MALSMFLNLYLLTRPCGSGVAIGASEPQRPSQPMIWVHCRNATDADHIRRVMRQMQDDLEQVAFVVTGQSLEADISPDGMIITSKGPGRNLNEISRFIDHWKPMGLVWIGGQIDPAIMAASSQYSFPKYLITADAFDFVPEGRKWLIGMRRSLLSLFDKILTVDQTSAEKFGRWGVIPDRIDVLGHFDDQAPVLPCNDAERTDFAKTIDTRPIWLVANAIPAEINLIIEAHRSACRRSHRLLLILVPQDARQAPELAAKLIDAGFETVLRSEGDPNETTRALVADLEGELGMWYRISPITYMGGTLTRGSRHPFEAAALGSVVVHGSTTAPYTRFYMQLDNAGGAAPIANGAALAKTIEDLLSPDLTAQIAHAAWDVTSRGSEVTNRIAALISAILDKAEG
jgi:3-deoxy-D-manno-octulosonic-acid transferase